MTEVREVMSTDVLKVAPTTTVAEAATIMSTRHVGSALVMEGDVMLGIFTERDILRAVGTDFDAEHHHVSAFMTHDPTTVAPDVEVRQALDTMLEHDFRHFPVTDGREVLGIVSIRDLTRAL